VLHASVTFSTVTILLSRDGNPKTLVQSKLLWFLIFVALLVLLLVLDGA
jgi:hypothetical protein